MLLIGEQKHVVIMSHLVLGEQKQGENDDDDVFVHSNGQ